MKTKITIGLLLICVHLLGQNHPLASLHADTSFLHKIQDLESGELSHVSLEFMDSVKIKPLVGDKIDDRDAHRYPSGYLPTATLHEITSAAICEITDHYILLVVEDHYNSLRAITVHPNGTPISSILIHDDLLFLSKFWYEYEARRYSPSHPFHFDPVTHEFTFSIIFKIMKPQYEETLIDLMDHEDETTNKWRLKVNENGVFDKPTYKHLNCPVFKLPSVSIKSSIFEEDSESVNNKPAYTIEDHKLKIFLDRDQSMRIFNSSPFAHDQVIRIIPESIGKIAVYQKISYGVQINGDGDYCELQDLAWSSSWEQLEMKNDIVSLKKYTPEDKITPQISVEDLKKKIKLDCGNYHLAFTNHIYKKADISSLIQPREVTLKVVFTDSETHLTTTEYIIFNIANGC